MKNIEKKIRELENEIATLPVGYISNKKINGKMQQYLQWTENGKKKSQYLDSKSAEELKPLIEKRRKLQAEVKSLKKKLSSAEEPALVSEKIKGFHKRNCISKLEDYLNNENYGKVFILYGLRRTGKTTLMRQAILSMSKDSLKRIAFIQLEQGDSLSDINIALKMLRKRGIK